MAYHHDRCAFKASRPADYRQIVTEVAVAVKFHKFGEGIADEVQGAGALGVPRKLHPFPRRETRKHILGLTR